MEGKHINTGYAERQNLNTRMSMRRFMPIANAFGKKAENYAHALAHYFTFYNFVRQHKMLRCSPEMAAYLSTMLWRMATLWK